MVAMILSISACDNSASSHAPADQEVVSTPELKGGSISPLPTAHFQDEDLAALGQQLFHDTALSSSGTISCASCHDIDRGGVDRLPRSPGVTGELSQVNSPTVLNSGFNFRQFWDGRAESLEEQAHGPLTNPIEMNNTWDNILAYLEKDGDYVQQFDNLFPDQITPGNVVAALAAFQRTLITANSPFDLYLRGDDTALNDEQLAGYELFQDLGCVSCHQGINIGGNMYQRIGVMGDYFADRGNITEADFGLYNVTGIETDRFKFKVPSLRNIADTAPYFHDGSATTVEDAIQTMAQYQLGVPLSSGEVHLLAAFLTSLSAPPLEVRTASTGTDTSAKDDGGQQ
ncbi:cytochrome-c peroxidase [Umboniibacter marinipuniceus]|uniref:Cytochrome c peroxidase n=1 Tax=Umboniibacter marinipuniceus TaxID=569599 RepID=A0A3M0ACF0_9GAMM|nr:cytochrome-c peroxidase [Umboniibacter marinipuniceus]RMA82600.1 cytochrome c peroxidase [Umboniibacter marinipuniceus]